MGLIHISIVSIVVLLNIFFGYKVYRANPKNKINQAFTIFVITTSIWLILDYFAYRPELGSYQLTINRMVFAAICLMIFGLSWFVDIFPKKLFNIPSFIKNGLIIFAGLLIIISLFTPWIVESVTVENWGSNVTTGNLFYLFIIYVAIFTLYPVVNLVVKVIKFKGSEKEQTKYVLYGVFILVLLNILFNLIVPLITNNFEYGRFGSYSVIFFVGFMAYAILKEGLFSLRIIVTESAVLIINVILITQIFTSKTIIEGALRFTLTIIVLYGSFILIQSVKREIKLREELQGAMEKLKELNKKLKEMDAMKTEFVSMASHELLTPISAIEGYLSMIVDEHLVKIEDPKALKFLANIYSSSKRLARLVGDLLNVSRIEQGRLLMQKTIVDVDALVNSVITELKFRAQERQMTMTPDFRAQGAQASSFADADKIKEILVNLTGNSIKYTQKGGQIVIAVDLWPTAQVEQRYQAMAVQMKSNGHTGALQRIANEKLTQMVGDHQIVISVADNGIGISPQDIGHLFQKFSRVGDWSTQEVQGTGLGLYISRALVEMHHGKIWAESPGEKKGTIFYFSLPLAQYQQQVLQLDNQVPQSRDAKPLARMGGGPAAKV